MASSTRRRGPGRRHHERVRRDADRPQQHAHQEPGRRGCRRRRPPPPSRSPAAPWAAASRTSPAPRSRIIDSTLTDNVARGGSSNAGVGGTGPGRRHRQQPISYADDDRQRPSPATWPSAGLGAAASRGGFGSGGGLDDYEELDRFDHRLGVSRGNEAVGGDGGSGANGGNGVGGGIGGRLLPCPSWVSRTTPS